MAHAPESAERQNLGTLPTIAAAPAPSAPTRRWLAFTGWAACALLLVGAFVFHRFAFEPALRKGSTLAQRVAATERARADLDVKVSRLEARVIDLSTERDTLRADRERLAEEAGRLSSTVQAHEEEIARLRAAQQSLEGRMADEIASGDIQVENVRGELRVKLADQILFPAGEAGLSERGGAVLRRVAESLASLEGYVIEVGGHTDSNPVRDTERFATNWELSTARATDVVRFLADQCAVPGERLVASGYAQFRPAGSNRSSSGRRHNRRIELTLRPRPASAG